MTVKHRLQEYKWIRENIQALEDRLLEIDTQLQKVTSNMSDDRVQTSKDNDKWTNLVGEKMKVEEHINKEIVKGYKEMGRIEKMIEHLDEREKLLIRYRYIDCLTWEEIACKMYYTWQHMHRIHASCLRNIKKNNNVIECDTKMMV